MINSHGRASEHGRHRWRQALWAVVCTLLASGVDTAGAVEIPGVFTAVRPIGMGDAFTAVANDENSAWTNPAGIGRSRKFRSRGVFNLTKIPDLIVGANAETKDFYDAVKGSQKESVASVLANGKDIGDKPLWLRAGAYPVTIFDIDRDTTMAFGLYSNTTIAALVQSDTPQEAQIQAVSDAGGVIDIGWSTEQNRVNFGFQLRPIVRYAYEGRVPSSDLVSKSAMTEHLRDQSNKLTGYGLDFGALYTFSDFWFPTIGAAVLNLPTGCKKDYLNPYSQTRQGVCGNLYHGTIGNSDALSVIDPTDVRFGLAITPRLGRDVSMHVAVDVHNLPVSTGAQTYGLKDIPVSQLLHAGLELYYGNPFALASFSLRGGVNQGFFTSGFTLNFGIIDLEFATYGVDVSSTAKQIEDRRYLASLSMNF